MARGLVDACIFCPVPTVPTAMTTMPEQVHANEQDTDQQPEPVFRQPFHNALLSTEYPSSPRPLTRNTAFSGLHSAARTTPDNLPATGNRPDRNSRHTPWQNNRNCLLHAAVS